MKKSFLILTLFSGLHNYSFAENVNTDQVVFLDDDDDEIDKKADTDGSE